MPCFQLKRDVRAEAKLGTCETPKPDSVSSLLELSGHG